jgi:adenylate kinase
MSVSRAKFTREAVKKQRARTKSIAAPYSCRMFRSAVTKATITSIDVMMALTIEKKIDLFSNATRRLRRGISDFQLCFVWPVIANRIQCLRSVNDPIHA